MASSGSLALDRNRFLAHWGQAPGDLERFGAHGGQAPGDLAHTGDRPPAIWRTLGTGPGRFGVYGGQAPVDLGRFWRAEGLEA